ncbi:MAG: hypothetical protein ACLQJR_02565 [Stellaceae bacterium]
MTATGTSSRLDSAQRTGNGLRGRLAAELADPSPAFGAAGEALLGFHGIRRGADGDFILRVRVPAGRLAAPQYLALDDLADRYGDGTVRLTPRQEVELHGLLKRDLKAAIGAIHLARLTTLAAGGHVARAVTATAARRDGVHRRLEEDARRLSEQLLPRSEAYDEIWLDGEGAAEEDALYGAADLPHKLEIGFAVPEDDALDVLANDLAFVALHEDERLLGYTLALGGLGDGTRAATPIAFIAPQDLLGAATAVVTLFREHGDRVERDRARLGHLIAERGDAWAKAQLEERLGKSLAAPRPLPHFHIENHLGWHEQGDGRLSLGLAVPGGRIADGGARRRTALRLVCKSFATTVLLLPQQVILGNIAPADRLAVATALRRLGVATEGGEAAPLALQEAS